MNDNHANARTLKDPFNWRELFLDKPLHLTVPSRLYLSVCDVVLKSMQIGPNGVRNVKNDDSSYAALPNLLLGTSHRRNKPTLKLYTLCLHGHPA